MSVSNQNITSTLLAKVNLFVRQLFARINLFEGRSDTALENVVQSMTNLMVLTDQAFRIQKVNQAFLDLFEVEKGAMLKRSVIAFLKLSEDKIRWKFDQGTKQIKQEFNWYSSNKYLYLGFTISPILNTDGKLIGYAFVGTDLTATKEATEKITKYAKEIEQYTKTLDRFTYITYHDLKEPLRNIRGFATLLRRKMGDHPDPINAEYLNYIQTGVDRLNTVIESIVEVSQLEWNEEPQSFTSTAKLVEKAVRKLDRLIKKKNATIQIGHLPEVFGAANQLELLFLNLVENGILYNNNPQPKVEILAYPTDGFHEFTIRDNGIGIAPDFHHRIFELYKRLNPQLNFNGAGVGLAICKKIVIRHEGEIWVDSSDGKKGTVIKLRIPTKLAQEKISERPHQSVQRVLQPLKAIRS